MKVKNIPVSLIRYPKVILRQPEDMTGIEDLANNIASYGLLNPLTVIEKEDYYELLAGGRRLEAVKGLNWEKVPCNIVSPSEDSARIITLIENQKRHDLHPLEEAKYYEYLAKELGIPQVKIAGLSGVTPAHVSQMLSLLDLDDNTMGALAAGDISASQARELARCPDASYREQLVDTIKKGGASVLILKRWVDEHTGFQSQAETMTGVLAPRPAVGEGGIRPVKCDLCDTELAYGGLQTIMACNDCYKRLMAALKEGVSPTVPA